MFTVVLELLKVMRPAPRRMLSVKRMRRVALMAVPPAGSRRRRVVRALGNLDLQLKLASAFRLLAAKRMAQAMPRLHPPAQQMIPAPQSGMPTRVSCSPDRQPLIPSRDQLAIAPCLCFCRPRRNWSAPWPLHRARPLVFSRAPRPACVRKYRRAVPGRSRPRQLRRKAQTKGQRRPRSKTARAIEIVRYWPFQFTNFKDSTRRGSRTGKSEVFPTMRK